MHELAVAVMAFSAIVAAGSVKNAFSSPNSFSAAARSNEGWGKLR